MLTRQDKNYMLQKKGDADKGDNASNDDDGDADNGDDDDDGDADKGDAMMMMGALIRVMLIRATMR